MLYQYVKYYLKTTFIQPTEDFNWSTLNSLQFTSFIKERYTNDEFVKEISEAKEAFRDFFEPVGKIVFHYSENNGVKIKIFSYRVAPQDSKHLKNILKIIENNKNHIKTPYKSQKDEIAILGKIRREINKELFESDESVNVRELIKYAIRVALKLCEKDIILQLKRMYIVKLWMYTKKRKESIKYKLLDNNMKLDQVTDKLAYTQPEKELQEKTIKDTQAKAISIISKHKELEAKLNYLGNTRLEFLTSQKKSLSQDIKAQNLNLDVESAQKNPITKVLINRTKLMDTVS